MTRARGQPGREGRTTVERKGRTTMEREGSSRAIIRIDVAAAVGVGVATISALWPVTSAAFLNWDDDAIFLRNPALTGAHPIAWAFTTTHMGHYQPLSWIAWAATARAFGIAPGPFHALNLIAHAAATVLVFVLAARLLSLAGVQRSRARFAAAAGALLFGVHPMRVEPVAWASAFPYVGALVFALGAVLAYVTSRRRPWRREGWRRPTVGAVGWSVAAIACFAISLGFRPIAVGLPLILLLLDWYPLDAFHRQAERHRAVPLVADKIPYLLIAVAAIGLEFFARRQTGFNELAPGARMTLVGTGPFVYLWRTIAPVGLSPVSVLPLNPQGSMSGVVCAIAILAMTVFAWRMRRQQPAVLAVWMAYLLLVAPTIGLAPTGLQAVADRYAYLPAVALAVGIAGVASLVLRRASRLSSGDARIQPRVAASAVALTAAAVVGALSVLTWKQTAVWHDSVALWTRAAQVDSANDVAFYNLGSALQDAGRADEAMIAYESTLRLVPDHAPARKNLNGLRAIARQRDADALAAAGDLAGAIPLYRETLTLDPRRARARAALGVALTRTGQFAAAAEELAQAMEQGVDDPAVANAAGYALVQTGRTRDAIRLLQDAFARHPDDPNIARNLQLLGR